MGAGYHGGFGNTKGSHKIGHLNSREANYTKEQLLEFLDGKTTQSSEIAESIRKGEIRLSVLGDALFERYFGVDSDVLGIAEENKIYLRKNSISLYSDIVHEGIHAKDYLKGIPYEEIKSTKGELRAYRAEHDFQKASGLVVEYANDDEIVVHVWNYYGKKGGRK